MARDIVQRVWSVLFDPTTYQHLNLQPPCLSYHGRLSSASTGKSATIRFCFPALLSELNCIDLSLDVGTSKSMSSS